jgi:hypothetical protein
MKKTYEKPSLVAAAKLAKSTAQYRSISFCLYNDVRELCVDVDS